MVKYFKITSHDECHHGYQYQNGLNVLDKPFAEEGSCVPGGLYFTTLEYLHEFYGYGVWIREIQIPEDAKMVKDPGGHKWRADRIILGEKHSLFDVKSIQKLNLEVDENYVNRASGEGRVEMLEWLKQSKFEMAYSHIAIDLASGDGHLNVLEWWKNSGLELKYTEEAIDDASMEGHVKILEWWKNSGFILKYTNNAIDYASEEGHIKVLKWWKNSGLELKYTRYAIHNDWAAFDGQSGSHPKSLEWWKNSGLPTRPEWWPSTSILE